jgi:cellulose synthase/poly-beta-1,6-N-acetylglucosamine synthase-like glycosyltransferase
MYESFLNTLWIIFQLVIGYNLVFPLLLAFISLFQKKQTPSLAAVDIPAYDYAIIVTAYEQTHTLPPVIASLLQLQYQHFLIYIVADKCDVSKLMFDDERVIVLRPESTLASNTRSHFYAINRFKRAHTHLTIIDSDNLVEPDYLSQLNPFFAAGYQAVQGVRDAKNLNTTYACLDAARDIYYHYYDGALLFSVGSSATLAGSGMAFTVELYKTCLSHLDIVGAGFDKVLQYEIVNRNYRIAFATKAVVYDEKTAKSDQLVKQRARWINTWLKYVHFGFKLTSKGLFSFSWGTFIFGIVLLRSPLFIFLITSGLCMLINLLVNPFIAGIWAIGFVLFISGFFLALLRSHTDPRIYRSLWLMPKFIFFQVKSLLKVAKANELSVATKHEENQ